MYPTFAGDRIFLQTALTTGHLPEELIGYVHKVGHFFLLLFLVEAFWHPAGVAAVV
jgi:hypothetical protein